MIKRKFELESLNKAAIIEEYLSGEDSYQSLGEKYGVSGRTIQSWVRQHRKGKRPEKGELETGKEKELQKEIERLKLKNELLEEILNLSENQTGVNLRKKFGPKR